MAQKEYFRLKEKTLLWLNFEIKVLKMSQYHLDPVQHLIDRAAEDTDVIEIEQEHEITVDLQDTSP